MHLPDPAGVAVAPAIARAVLARAADDLTPAAGIRVRISPERLAEIAADLAHPHGLRLSALPAGAFRPAL